MATSCFPSAIGVPGNSTPPDWLSGTAAPFDGSPDDPRWVGSFTHSFGDGAGVQVLFRGLRDPGNTTLLLSWLVKVDPAITAGQDSVFVGFGNSAGTAGLMIQIQLATSATTNFGTVATGAYAVVTELFSGGAWSAVAAPAWIANGTRVWINYGSPITPFAVQMVVPIGTFLDATNTVKIQPNTDFKMWYTAALNTPGEVGADVQYQWPATPLLTVFPSPSQFADARVSNIFNDPACTQAGITIDYLDIGTKNLDGSTRPDSSAIRFAQTGTDATAPNHTNMFFAHPNFPAGTAASRKAQVLARFRLANWGSQIGTLTSNSWKNIPGGDNVPCDTAQNGGESHFNWPTQAEMNVADPATMALLTLFRNGTTTTDQCMLVELSSTFPGEVFLNNSIRRNMDLVGASKFSRDAEISIVGLQPFSASPRDVFLYLETVNMPAKATQDSEGRRQQFAASLATDTTHASAAQIPKPTLDDLIKYLPTYRIHTYHDTGLTTNLLGGGTRRVLVAQSSFGYLVHHDGPLVGWAARLNGALRIAESFYLLRIENNGTAKVTTALQGVEPGEAVLPEEPIVRYPPPPPPNGGCLGWIRKLFKP